MSPILGIYASQISGHLYAASYESIATVTVGTSVANISFSSIPSTYKHLQIRINALTTSSSIQPQMRVGNGSVDTGANYSRHSLYGDGGSAAAYGNSSVNQYVLGGLATGMGSTYPSSIVIDLLDYADTSKNKTIRSLMGVDNNGSGEIGLHSGVWLSTSAINTISVIAGGGQFAQYSSFALYGIKEVA